MRRYSRKRLGPGYVRGRSRPQLRNGTTARWERAGAGTAPLCGCVSETMSLAFDLDHELDALYGVDLDLFVAERTQLVRALRKEGRRAEAVTVQELRKPSLVVWAVNQLARRHGREVGQLLDAGRRLAATQTALLSGGDLTSFDEARGREQMALRRLRPAIGAILGERAPPSTLDRVVTTLRAAVVAEGIREDLARGRLTHEVTPAGFEAFSGLGPPARNVRRPREREEAPARTQRSNPRLERAAKAAIREEAIARAREVLKAAREREGAVVGELRRVDQAARQARKTLDSAEKELRRVHSDREAAGREVEAARLGLEAARSSRS